MRKREKTLLCAVNTMHIHRESMHEKEEKDTSWCRKHDAYVLYILYVKYVYMLKAWDKAIIK